MKLPFGSGWPLAFSGVTRLHRRIRGVAPKLFMVPPAALPVSDGIGTLVPDSDSPVLGLVNGVCGKLGT